MSLYLVAVLQHWACALEAAKQQQKVLVLNKYPLDFVRTGRVSLSSESLTYLLNQLPKGFEKEQLSKEDQDFLNELSTRGHVAIKSIERFLLRRINECEQRVDFNMPATIQSIDLDQGRIELISEQNSDKVYEFKYLIGADGAKHPSATVYKQQQSNPPIEFDEIPKPRHPYHLSAYLCLKSADGEILAIPDQDNFSLGFVSDEDELLCTISLDKAYYAKHDQKEIKISFLGEIPERLYDDFKSHDRRAIHNILKFIRNFIAEVFAQQQLPDQSLELTLVKPSRKHRADNKAAADKDKLRLVAFKTDLVQADKACVELNGHIYLLAGDAYRSPDYYFRHGTTHAFMHAEFFHQVLTKEMTLEEYDQECQNLSNPIRMKTNRFFNKPANDRAIQAQEAANEMKSEIRDTIKYFFTKKQRV